MRDGKLALLMVLLVAVAAVGVVAVPVAAQEGNQTQPAQEETRDENASSVVAEVDEQVRVLSHSYNREAGVMTVTLSHIDPEGSSEQLTLTEMIDAREGSSGTFGVETLRIRPGETVSVEVNAAMTDGTAGVMIVSETSLSRGEGTFVREGEPPTSIFEGAASWTDVRVGAGVGILATIVTMLLVSWQVVANKNNEYQEVEI